MDKEHVMIRRIRLDDLDNIQKFCFEQISHAQDPLGNIRISERQYAWEMKRVRQNWLAQQRYVAYVAAESTPDGEKLVGYGAAVITCQAHFCSIENVASLGELWVSPEYRGIGIGRQLVDAILEELKNIGIEWITAHLGGNEMETEAFFHKIGFSTGALELRKNIT